MPPLLSFEVQCTWRRRYSPRSRNICWAEKKRSYNFLSKSSFPLVFFKSVQSVRTYSVLSTTIFNNIRVTTADIRTSYCTLWQHWTWTRFNVFRPLEGSSTAIKNVFRPLEGSSTAITIYSTEHIKTVITNENISQFCSTLFGNPHNIAVVMWYCASAHLAHTHWSVSTLNISLFPISKNINNWLSMHQSNVYFFWKNESKTTFETAVERYGHFIY